MQKAELKQFKLPDQPGVYFFKRGRTILYIGKAASLRDRVRSYFSADLAETRSPAIAGMVAAATTLDWRTADSVLEALIVEANLIKQHQPTYNVDQKDNKSWNYVVLTKEAFPRVLLVRGRDLYQRWSDADIKHLFGPFPAGGALKEALKIVRRIFSYRDAKCTPCDEQKKKPCAPCFNRQIGLCPGVCTGEMTQSEYATRIKHICQFFSGNFKGLKRELAKEMKAASKQLQYERAAELRRQIGALEHIRDVSLIKDESRISSGGGARIEAYDVAHTSGTETVAVMTVVAGGQPYKAAYRKFKIHTATNDDVAALTEALTRRLNHPEWPLPRVFVVDGGKGQMRAAEKILKTAGLMIPVVGVVKDERHRPSNLIGDRRSIEAFEKDILLANAEAHRFGIRWHRERRGKLMV